MSTTETTETASDYPKESWFPGDPFTMGLELCDFAGKIRVELLNRLRAQGGHEPYDGEPFECSGHAHLAGEHIECLSIAHRTTSVPVQGPTFVALPSNDGYACLRIAREVRDVLAAVPEPDDDTRSLMRDADALERVGNWLTMTKPILLPVTIANGFPSAAP